MKNISIFLILLFLVTPCFADIEVDGYRIYVGENKDIDWIDVCCLLDDNFELWFEERSPIIQVLDFPSLSTMLIQKENSLWEFYYGGKANYEWFLKLLSNNRFSLLKYLDIDYSIIYNK